MGTIGRLIGKVGFTAVGVGVGLVVAAGSGAAAVHLSQTAAADHSIGVVQSVPSGDDRVHPEDTNLAASAELNSVASSDDTSAEAQAEPGDDNRSSSTTSVDDSRDGSGQSGTPAPRSPEPGDDHGRDGKR